MRRIFMPLPPRLPLRAAGPLAVSVITPNPPSSRVPPDPSSASFAPLCGSVKDTARYRDRRLLPVPFPSSGLAGPPVSRAWVVDVPADFPQMTAAQLSDCLLEVVERLEAPVDAGKPE